MAERDQPCGLQGQKQPLALRTPAVQVDGGADWALSRRARLPAEVERLRRQLEG